MNKAPEKPTVSDKFLAATFLRLIPRKVTPNQITIFRFFSIPFIALFFWLEKYGLGALLFVIAAFSDSLDGALARTTNRITKWGKMYDPLADKLLIATTALIILPRFINPWVIFLIILLEIMLISVSYYRTKHKKTQVAQANWWGKSKMISQSLGIIFVLIYILTSAAVLLTIAQVLFYMAIILAIISLITYSL